MSPERMARTRSYGVTDMINEGAAFVIAINPNSQRLRRANRT